MDSPPEKLRLAGADYAVVSIMLALSAAIGIYFAIRERRSENIEGYLLGGRRMNAVPVAVSLALSSVTGSSLLGTPAEVVYFGSAFCWAVVSSAIGAFIAQEVYLPIFYRLGLFSANEYLGLRFNNLLRSLATAVFIIQTVTYCGVMVYAPALALNAVSGLDLWIAILSMGLVCTLYTTIGGIKAVIWTDIFQGVVLLSVFIVVIAMSVSSVGGFDEVWRRCQAGDRLDFFRASGTHQGTVQRFLSCKSVRTGRRSVFLAILLIAAFQLLTFLAGFSTYAYFADCDPFLAGDISSRDQVVPYMVMRLFRRLPGLAGLFVAGVFAGALSTISSGINGMVCVTVSDFVQPYFPQRESVMVWISKGVTILYGALCIAFAFLSSVLGGLLQTSLSLMGICGGPLLGVFSLGVFFPFANSLGALCGMTTSFAIVIWLYVGSQIDPRAPKFARAKDLSIDGCRAVLSVNATTSSVDFVTSAPLYSSTSDLRQDATAEDVGTSVADFYALSYLYYTVFGFCVCMCVGLIVSCLSGGWQTRSEVDPMYIFRPREHRFVRWLEIRFRCSNAIAHETELNEKSNSQEVEKMPDGDGVEKRRHKLEDSPGSDPKFSSISASEKNTVYTVL